MSNHIETVKELYAAFGRGDINYILARMANDVSWEFEAPAELSWSGIRRGPQEAAGFFAGIADVCRSETRSRSGALGRRALHTNI